MKSPSGQRGATGTEILVCLFLASIFIAGYSTLDSLPRTDIPARDFRSPGYGAVSTAPRLKGPWWDQKNTNSQNDAFILDRFDSERVPPKIDDSGLKAAKDISWPYGTTCEYEMVQGAYPYYSVYPGKGWFTCTYTRDKSGAKLVEEFEYQIGERSSQDWRLFRTTTETDLVHKINSVKFESIQLEKIPQGNSALTYKTPMYDLELEKENSKLHWTTKVHAELAEAYGVKRGNPVVTDVLATPPDTGVFYYTGADTPGHIALLMTTFNVSRDTSFNKTGAVGGGDLALFASVDGTLIKAEPIFTSVVISDIDNLMTDHLKIWWESTRAAFGGWKPPAGINTFILYELGENYLDHFQKSESNYKYNLYKNMYETSADLVIVYVDKMDRVVRVEQIGGTYCTAAELRKIDGQTVKWSY